MIDFPLKGHRSSEVADGVTMETHFTLYSNGAIDGVTKSWTSNSFEGAHGVAGVILYAGEHAIWFSGAHQCGVAGRLDPTGPSDRTESWNEQVPDRVMEQVTGYAIVHENRAGSDFLDWVKSNSHAIFCLAGVAI